MRLPIGLCAQLACIWEVTARKPGNVHRYRDFPDLHFTDFLTSAAVVAPILDRAVRRSVGATVVDAIRATRQVVATNVNLGIVLLLAPLAKAPRRTKLRSGVEAVLAKLDLEDSRQVFEAIRMANPGGLGRVAEEDVQGEPTRPLREIMAIAAERDLIARQYANGFQEVFDDGLPALLEGMKQTKDLEEAIILCHLHLLAKHPDSLIQRKCGREEAEEASLKAGQVLDAGWPKGQRAVELFQEFDAWLGEKGNRRNPGTTADLVTACLFAAFRDELIPFK